MADLIDHWRRVSTVLRRTRTTLEQTLREVDAMGTKLALFRHNELGGFGFQITGGTGGNIVYVTTLEDNVGSPPAGSLREAVMALTNVPTVIAFAVTGRITLLGELKADAKSNFTIDGNGNIEIARNRLLIAGCTNVIIRRLRFRLGIHNLEQNGTTSDCVTVYQNALGQYSERVAIDSCSAALWTDEGISLSRCRDSVISNCIVGYGLNANDHALAGIYRGERVGVYSSYFAHCIFRPLLGGDVQVDRCVFYNYLSSDPNIITSDDIAPSTTTRCDATNNRYIGGPSTANNTQSTFRSIRVITDGCSLYQTGNEVLLYGSPVVYPPVVRNNPGINYASPGTPHFAPSGLTHDASDTPYRAGCPGRDVIDERLVADYTNRTGTIIVHPSEVGWSE